LNNNEDMVTKLSNVITNNNDIKENFGKNVTAIQKFVLVINVWSKK